MDGLLIHYFLYQEKDGFLIVPSCFSQEAPGRSQLSLTDN